MMCVTKPRGAVASIARGLPKKKNNEPNGRRRQSFEEEDRSVVSSSGGIRQQRSPVGAASSPGGLGLLSRPWFVFLAGAVAATAAGRLRQPLEEEPAKVRKATAESKNHRSNNPAALRKANPGLMAELACLRERMAAAKEGREDDIEYCEPYVVSNEDIEHQNRVSSAQLHHSSLAIEEEEKIGAYDERPFSPLRIVTLCVLTLSLAFFAWFVQNVDHLPEAMEAYLVGSSNTPSLRKLIAYRVDCWFSSNPYSKSLALLYLSIALVVYGGGFLYGVSGTR
jgi:hypothetical protein